MTSARDLHWTFERTLHEAITTGHLDCAAGVFGQETARLLVLLAAAWPDAAAADITAAYDAFYDEHGHQRTA